MTRIESVEARTVDVPLAQAKSFATREVRTRHYTLVRVRDDAGVEGIGFCYAGNVGGRVVSLAVRELIGPCVVGQDPLRVRGMWEDTYQATLLHGRAGVVMRALSATDVAVWDLNARAAGLPLWRYLGAASDTSVPAYASGGYYLSGKGPDALAAEMAGYVSAGFRAVKMKVGAASAEYDAERLAAVRAAVGPQVLVMLDANNAWHDLPTAARALRLLEPWDPYWIEEPFGPDDIENHARLARLSALPVATGEIEAGRWRYKQLLDAGAAAILQADAAVCGGITEFQRIAALADAHGAVVAPHWFHDLHVHLVASTSNAVFVEYFPDDAVLNFRRLIDAQLGITGDGRVALPERPGLGFGFDGPAVDRYAQEPWA